MKKITLLLVLAFCTFMHINAQEGVTNAQEDGDGEFVSKRGINILPEAGDIGLGISAIPIVNYFGNTFNGTANNSAQFNFTDAANTIYAKYFLDDASAIRIKFRYATGKVTNLEYITQDSIPVPDPLVVVEDKETVANTNIAIGLGYEIRRGHGRVQGFYGGELMLTHTSGNSKYEYGNPYSVDFTNPPTTNFGTNITATGRVTEQKLGNTIGFGLGGFIGVEYFFAPKMSVGGEFGYGLALTNTGDGEATEEQWTGTEVLIETTKTGGGNTWGLDTDNAFGAIFLMFHF